MSEAMGRTHLKGAYLPLSLLPGAYFVCLLCSGVVFDRDVHDLWHQGKSQDTHSMHVAEQIAAELLKAALVAMVQSAIVNAMNTVGVALVGSTFELIESPIPDDEVAQIIGQAGVK